MCRSPYAEFLIEDAFLDDPTLQSVQVGSAGIRPVRRGQICSLVAERRPHSDRWDEFVRRHSSIRATRSRVAQARLILTASRSNRAAIAQIDPETRSRTFTLREAAWLGSDYVRAPDLEGAAAIIEFARYLDSQRGIKPPIPAIRTLPFARPGDAMSIADGHHLKPRDHRATLKEVERVSAVISRLISVGSEQGVSAAR